MNLSPFALKTLFDFPCGCFISPRSFVSRGSETWCQELGLPVGVEAKLEAGLSGIFADSQMICQMINEGLI